MSFPSTAVEGPRNQSNWEFLSQYLIVGRGAPEGKVRGRIGALYTREDGKPGETLYVKEEGDGTTEGWAVKT